MTHFHWVTPSYGGTFPRVSECAERASVVKRSVAEHASDWTSAAERTSERASGLFSTVPFQLYPTVRLTDQQTDTVT